MAFASRMPLSVVSLKKKIVKLCYYYFFAEYMLNCDRNYYKLRKLEPSSFIIKPKHMGQIDIHTLFAIFI